nr:unnamed protein product [Haemonchus contortus]
MSYNETTAMQPADVLRLVDGPINKFGRYQEPDSADKGQDFGSAAMEKLDVAIKQATENIGDKLTPGPRDVPIIELCDS